MPSIPLADLEMRKRRSDILMMWFRVFSIKPTSPTSPYSSFESWLVSRGDGQYLIGRLGGKAAISPRLDAPVNNNEADKYSPFKGPRVLSVRINTCD